MTQVIRSLILEGTKALETVSSSPRLDAELLLARVLGLSKIQLLSSSNEAVSNQFESEFRELLSRRVSGEPIPYILGEREFWGLSFRVSPAVLIPRPETELIVELAVKELKDRTSRVSVLDLGTGSGCIVISIIKELMRNGVEAYGTAIDLSEGALEVAMENAKAHGVLDRIRFLVGNWYVPLSRSELFDLIVSNPPYIEPGDPLLDPSTRCEPPEALFATDEGISALREVISDAANYLLPGGALICEFGYGQEGKVQELVNLAGTYARNFVALDMTGIPRSLVAIK